MRLHRGEVLGIFGLVGAGRTELLKLIYGAIRPSAGKIKVWDEAVKITKPSEAISHGVVYCPEDRKKEGIIPLGSVKENINISVRRLLAWFGFINEQKDQANAQKFVERLNIKTPTLKRPGRGDSNFHALEERHYRVFLDTFSVEYGRPFQEALGIGWLTRCPRILAHAGCALESVGRGRVRASRPVGHWRSQHHLARPHPRARSGDWGPTLP